MRLLTMACLIAACALARPVAQESPGDAARKKTFDVILDTYVRDGLVYYRALRAERGRLDGYVASLADVAIDSAPHDEAIAFWLNAYNALVLKTVVDHYPITRRTQDYPARSIRQIPGAFEKLPHRVARRTVTLDDIEQKVLPGFNEPRVYFALGRGAIDSGRLRSEAFSAATLGAQLGDVAAECVMRASCFDVDRTNNQVSISSIFSWRSQQFVAAYATAAGDTFALRSPIERAVLTFVEPKLLTTEKEFLEKNQFKVVFKPFNWELNDLTGRGGR
jgi:Protein of unknown function, DUF547